MSLTSMLGHLVPCGGGKPIPLAKTRLVLCSRQRTGDASVTPERQAELEFVDGYWTVRCLAEAGTVRVNDAACETSRLNPGDVLMVDRHRYRIAYLTPESTPPATPPLRTAAPTAPAQPQILGVLVPCGGGAPITMKKIKVVIGRAPTCDVVLPHKVVSGKHCILEFLNGHWQLVDLESHNGTFVDGISYRMKWLFPGNVLGVASHHRYRVEYSPRGEPPSAKEDDIPVMSQRSLLGSVGLTSDRLDKILRSEPKSEEPQRMRWTLDDE